MRFFDEVDYLLRYPDVRSAVRTGLFASGEHHYDAFGKREGRLARRCRRNARTCLFLRGVGRRARGFLTVIRPQHDHWSGVNLQMWRQHEGPGRLSVSVLRFTRTGLKRVRHTTVPLSDIDDRYPPPLCWKPIERSARRRFILFIREIGARGSSLAAGSVLLEHASEAHALYSEPEPEVAFPRALVFSPVTQCNLNCIHCVSRHTRQRLSVFSSEWWSEIATAARSGLIEHLTSDYSGDLLFSDRRYGGWLDRMIELQIPFEIDTHANDLTDEVIDRLITSRLRRINFSIDSMDPDDYLRIRRGARPLAEVLGNIRRFMAARNRRRPDIHTMLSFVLMRRNLDSISAAIDFVAEVEIAQLCGVHLQAYTPDMAAESLLLDPRRYARTHGELMAKAREKSVLLTLPPPVRSAVTRRGHTPCRWPWQAVSVLGNGDVMACCVPGTTVGNLRDGTLAELWNGPAMREFRRRVNSDNPPEPCAVCPEQRLANNFASYVPGLEEHARREFETRCVVAAREGSGARP